MIKVTEHIFSDDIKSKKELVELPGAPIENVVLTITSQAGEEAIQKGAAFADEITEKFVSDFEKECNPKGKKGKENISSDYNFLGIWI